MPHLSHDAAQHAAREMDLQGTVYQSIEALTAHICDAGTWADGLALLAWLSAYAGQMEQHREGR